MIDAELKIAFGNLVAAVADLGERYAVINPPPGQVRPALDRYTIGEFCDRFGPPGPEAPPVTRSQVLDVLRDVMRVEFGVSPDLVTEQAALVPLLAAATGTGAIATAPQSDPGDDGREADPDPVAESVAVEPSAPAPSLGEFAEVVDADSPLPDEGEPIEAGIPDVPTSEPLPRRWWRGRSS